jgi:hypothetical protein
VRPAHRGGREAARPDRPAECWRCDVPSGRRRWNGHGGDQLCRPAHRERQRRHEQGEGVRLDRMFAHGGFFKTKGVAQRLLAAAIDTPVSVGEVAAEAAPGESGC